MVHCMQRAKGGRWAGVRLPWERGLEEDGEEDREGAGSDQALVGHGQGLGADGKLLEDLNQGSTLFDVYSWTIAWVLRGKGRSREPSEEASSLGKAEDDYLGQ